MDDDPQAPRWREYFEGLALYLVLSGITAWFSYLWLSSNIGHPAGLESTISLIKALSLAALVIIGGLEIVRQQGCPKILYWINSAIMIWAVVLALGIVVKIVVSESLHSPPPSSFAFQGTYELMASFEGNFLSITPILLFAIVNAVTALGYIGEDEDLQRMSLSFLCISDIPCIVPILGVLTMYGCLSSTVADGGGGELFVSGAMAMFILISNILVLVVRYVARPIVVGPSRASIPATSSGKDYRGTMEPAD